MVLARDPTVGRSKTKEKLRPVRIPAVKPQPIVLAFAVSLLMWAALIATAVKFFVH